MGVGVGVGVGDDARAAAPPVPASVLTTAGPTAVILVLALLSAGTGPGVVVQTALALVAAVPLLWRHRAPRVVLAVTVAAVSVQALLGSPQTNSSLAQWVATAAVVRRATWPRSLAAPVAVVVVNTAVSSLATPAGGVHDFLLTSISAVVAWTVGDAQARRAAARARIADELVAREASSALRSRSGAISERLRISDETGRLLGGTLDAVLAQVRAGRAQLATGGAAQHLAAVEEQGRLALAHLDRYLELLRTPQAPDVQPPPAPPRPAGLDAVWTSPRAGAALAWAPVVLLLPLALFEYPRSAPEHASALTAGLTTAQVLPLAVRSRWPLPVAAVIAAALGAQLLLGHPVFNATIALPLALLTVAQRCSRRTAVALAGVAVTALTASGLGLSAQYGVEYGIVLAIASAVAVYTGESWRLLAAQDAQWQDRLDRSVHDEQLRVRSAVDQERLRAAQDLHDSVGHVLSLVTLQAGAARMSVHTSPERARAALDAIEDASLAALAELDRGIDGSGEDSGRVRTLADVRRLADTVRAAGVGVVLKIDEPGGGLPPLLETTAFRIVQEALTNAVKHAPGSTAVVTVVRHTSRVDLTVHNTAGRVPPVVEGVPSGRRGVHGMRERVALFGGELHAGPQPGGGFRVHATLPILELPTQRPAPAPEAPPVDESDRQLS